MAAASPNLSPQIRLIASELLQYHVQWRYLRQVYLVPRQSLMANRHMEEAIDRQNWIQQGLVLQTIP